MKMKALRSLLLLLMLCFISTNAYAINSASADIPVTVEGGGTAIMISEVNSPFPEASKLEIESGKTGHFIIHFTEPGNYHYTVAVRPVNGQAFMPEHYKITVSVNTNDDGSYYTVTIISRADSGEKSDSAAFKVSAGESTTVPPSPAAPPVISENEEPSSSTLHNPKTGDDSSLEMYLLLAVAASAGLFGLSLIYSYNTKKLMNNRQ